MIHCMSQSKIHVRYAKALFQLAREKGLLDEVKKDMDFLLRAYSENDNFSGLAANPAIGGRKKHAIFAELFIKNVHALTFSFLELLLEKKRELFVPGIARRYTFLYRKEKNILSVTLISSGELVKETVDMILNKLKELFCCEVEFDLKMDENLIGGFQLKIDDVLLDASIQGELKKIRNTLIEKTALLRT